MDDVSDEAEVERRLVSRESGWAVDENDNMACKACWAKWDAKHGTPQEQE